MLDLRFPDIWGGTADWNGMLTLLIVSVIFLITKFIKTKIPFFKKVIIPTALLAGVLTLTLGPNGFGIIYYDIEVAKTLLYHSIGIGFIAIALKNNSNKVKGNTKTAGAVTILVYMIQAIFGIGLTLLFFRDLFPGLGMLLTLGFGQGPGLASSISGAWEEVVDGTLVFAGAQDIGIIIATLGFLWGGIAGVIIVNRYLKKRNMSAQDLETDGELLRTQLDLPHTNNVKFFDSLAIQFITICALYLISYLTMTALSYGLSLNAATSDLGALLRGLNYLFGIIFAIIYKKIKGKVFKKEPKDDYLTNNYMLQNIASFAFNIMIVSSIMTITPMVFSKYWMYILIITTGGAIVTYFFIKFAVKLFFKEYHEEYTIMMFGQFTGTAATGLALLKVLDPEFKTPVAEDCMVGGSAALVFAIPLLALLGLVSKGWERTVTGEDGFINDPIKVYGFYIFVIVYFFILGTSTLLATRKENN